MKKALFCSSTDQRKADFSTDKGSCAQLWSSVTTSADGPNGYPSSSVTQEGLAGDPYHSSSGKPSQGSSPPTTRYRQPCHGYSSSFSGQTGSLSVSTRCDSLEGDFHQPPLAQTVQTGMFFNHYYVQTVQLWILIT